MGPVHSLKTVTSSDLDSRWQGSDLLWCRCCWSHLLCCFALMSWLVVGLSSCYVFALSCVSVLGHIAMYVCTFLCQCSRSYCHVCLHFPVSVFSVILPCMFALSCVSVLRHIAMYVCTFLCQCSRSYCPCMLQRKGVHCKMAVCLNKVYLHS